MTGIALPQYHHPNPLDLLFFASDAAGRRLGLPPASVQLILELDGMLDVDRLRRAVAAAQRVYPVLNAPCEVSAWTGRPRWRLDSVAGTASKAVHVHTAAPGADRPASCILDDFFAHRRPSLPVEFHVIRGSKRGDRVLVRWPHTLMDARGGYAVIEEVDRLFCEAAVPATLDSAGDESRDDYTKQLLPPTLGQRIRAARQTTSQPAGPTPHYAYLATGPIPGNPGELRCVTRHLTPEQTDRVRERAEQVCGSNGFGVYLRACGLRALHEILPHSVPGDALYALLNVIDNRRRQQDAPVCRNLTSSLPLVVPVAAVMDRRRVGQMLRQQIRAHVRSRTMSKVASLLWLLTRLPTAWLGTAIRINLRPGRRVAPRLGAIPPPSLPMGLMLPFVRPMATFCGVGLRNYYGGRPAVPDTGFCIDANLTPKRLNLTGVCYENRVAVQTLATLLDRLVATLLE